MLHVPYALKESSLHGIGLFTSESLKKGQLIYTASPVLDLNITQEQFDALTDSEKKEVTWWGFFDQPTQRWHVDFDVTKFINHSLEGTVTQDPHHTEAYLVATRDIAAGEELTQNYLEFETVEDLKQRGIAT